MSANIQSPVESYSHFVIPKSPAREYYMGTGSEVGLPGTGPRTENRVRDNYHRAPSSFWNPELDMAFLKAFPRNPKVEEEFVFPFISYPYWKLSVATSQSLSALSLLMLLKAMVTSQKIRRKKIFLNHHAKATLTQLGKFSMPPDRIGLA